MPRGNPKREWWLQISHGTARIQRYFIAGCIFRWGPYTRAESDAAFERLITPELLADERRFSLLASLWEFSQPCFFMAQTPDEYRWTNECICHGRWNIYCRRYHPEILNDLRFTELK